MRVSEIAAILILLSAGSAAHAGPQCTEVARDKWLSEAAMKERIAQDGYAIEKFKVTQGNCYEIYGKDRDGQKAEVYFNPVDGAVVKAKKG